MSAKNNKNELKSKDTDLVKELRKLINNCNKNYVTKNLLDESIKYYYSRVEQKLSETKTDLFKWFIKTNIAQTSVIIGLLFALLDFFYKK
ncbi:MAG: hypothetical protein ACI8ZF_000729 [Candidatus Midichloriaceae bacterium]|jgi:hypothetical protein